jgi:hypothetical protein
MLFDIHVFGKAGSIIGVSTSEDIETALKVLESLGP